MERVFLLQGATILDAGHRLNVISLPLESVSHLGVALRELRRGTESSLTDAEHATV